MDIQTTDVSLGLGQLKRIRTQNYRGSLVSSVITIDKDVAASDIVAIMPIKPGASIHSIAFYAENPTHIGTVSLGVAGFKSPLPTPTAAGWPPAVFNPFARTIAEGGDRPAFGAEVLRLLGPVILGHNHISLPAIGKTLHELLCWDNHGVKRPLASYEPFADGLLMLVMETPDAIGANEVKVIVQHVDPAPVGSSLTSVVLDK